MGEEVTNEAREVRPYMVYMLVYGLGPLPSRHLLGHFSGSSVRLLLVYLGTWT